MENRQKTPNRLIEAASPYLRQHAYNPVDWYPWGEEAFAKAREEDKPVFLSIGYSTCHWCHVMARESFEDSEVANVLNAHFVSVKVDREERPDVDSVYMAVCQAFTGSGGWPMSIFMTAEQKPFFAGTYFPRDARHGSAGFLELLHAIQRNWSEARQALLSSADNVVAALKAPAARPGREAGEDLIGSAFAHFLHSYDAANGGFGVAPKFPAAHNLMFLMELYRKRGEKRALDMAAHTLRQMYRGGLFDHIGFGFCRYSTDPYFLAPHFEKMLYDNAMLMEAYCEAYELTRDRFYLSVAEKVAVYVLRDMRSPDGAFYSAQDADSEGEEGRFYLFEPGEITALLGESEGNAFNRRYGITERGNFAGGSIPNLLGSKADLDGPDDALTKLYEYRRKRRPLHTDDKALTAWNSLMIAALCSLYRVSRNRDYLEAALRARSFIENELSDGETLFAGASKGRRMGEGFLDDYAAYIHALIALYGATLDEEYLIRADGLSRRAVEAFFDDADGGFYISGRAHEALVLRPKETYDGAMPSGNSLMTYDLARLERLRPDGERARVLQKQTEFMRGEAAAYPAGYCMFLTALSGESDPPPTVTVAPDGSGDTDELPFLAGLFVSMRLLPAPTEEYPLINGRTTFYICRENVCLPPTNDSAALSALRKAVSE